MNKYLEKAAILGGITNAILAPKGSTLAAGATGLLMGDIFGLGAGQAIGSLAGPAGYRIGGLAGLAAGNVATYKLFQKKAGLSDAAIVHMVGGTAGGLLGAASDKDHRVRNALVGAAGGVAISHGIDAVGKANFERGVEKGLEEGRKTMSVSDKIKQMGKVKSPIQDVEIIKEAGLDLLKKADVTGFVSTAAKDLSHSDLKAKYDELVKSHTALQKAHKYLQGERALNNGIRDAALTKLAGMASMMEKVLIHPMAKYIAPATAGAVIGGASNPDHMISGAIGGAGTGVVGAHLLNHFYPDLL